LNLTKSISIGQFFFDVNRKCESAKMALGALSTLKFQIAKKVT
jgi:hypothetical protein